VSRRRSRVRIRSFSPYDDEAPVSRGDRLTACNPPLLFGIFCSACEPIEERTAAGILPFRQV